MNDAVKTSTTALGTGPSSASSTCTKASGLDPACPSHAMVITPASALCTMAWMCSSGREHTKQLRNGRLGERGRARTSGVVLTDCRHTRLSPTQPPQPLPLLLPTPWWVPLYGMPAALLEHASPLGNRSGMCACPRRVAAAGNPVRAQRGWSRARERSLAFRSHHGGHCNVDGTYWQRGRH